MPLDSIILLLLSWQLSHYLSTIPDQKLSHSSNRQKSRIDYSTHQISIVFVLFYLVVLYARAHHYSRLACRNHNYIPLSTWISHSDATTSPLFLTLPTFICALLCFLLQHELVALSSCILTLPICTLASIISYLSQQSYVGSLVAAVLRVFCLYVLPFCIAPSSLRTRPSHPPFWLPPLSFF